MRALLDRCEDSPVNSSLVADEVACLAPVTSRRWRYLSSRKDGADVGTGGR
jgi:hypothetical protein